MVLFEAAVSIIVHFAKEFDALYVHYGQAVYACEILNSNIDNISGLSSLKRDLDSFMDMPEKRRFTARMTDRLRTTVIPVPTV